MCIYHKTEKVEPLLLLVAQEAIGVKPEPLDAVVPDGDAGALGREHPLLGQHDRHAGRAGEVLGGEAARGGGGQGRGRLGHEGGLFVSGRPATRFKQPSLNNPRGSIYIL